MRDETNAGKSSGFLDESSPNDKERFPNEMLEAPLIAKPSALAKPRTNTISNTIIQLLEVLNRLPPDKQAKTLEKILLESETENQGVKYEDLVISIGEDKKIQASSKKGEAKGELKLDVNLVNVMRYVVEKRCTNKEILEYFGGILYDAIFPIDIRTHFRVTQSFAEDLKSNLRIRLIFEDPKLSALPWELLYEKDTGTFLCSDHSIALSRYIEVPKEKREIKFSLPLRILLIISSPSDLKELDSKGEVSLIQDALSDMINAGKIELDPLYDATIINIKKRLGEKNYNIIHFIGHGDFEDDMGYIFLVEPDGSSKKIRDVGFCSIFSPSYSIGLVILNACHGATVSSHRGFSGVAPNLVIHGIPAVIAMQFQILDETAKNFAYQFYLAIAQRFPVDAAIQEARNLIFAHVGSDKPDFAIPVLYMRAEDGIIFNHRDAELQKT